jgi:hypothetical protein
MNIDVDTSEITALAEQFRHLNLEPAIERAPQRLTRETLDAGRRTPE